MATATEQASDFLKHVKRANPGFTRSRSSLERLLDHLDSELKKSTKPAPFKGAFQRDRYDSAIGLCKNPKDARIAKYRPALWCLAKVWGTAERYPVQGGQNLRVLHVAIVKYDTQASQADSIDARKNILIGALATAAQVSDDYVNPSSQPMWGMLAAPEYMFAKPATNGDHDVGDERHLQEGSKATLEGWLHQLSASSPKWLLFPGTIAWKKALVRDRAKYLRRHGRANPGVDPTELARRFDAKTQTRTAKAIGSLGAFKNTFGVDHGQQLSGDKSHVEDYQKFPPDTDWWFATDLVTAKTAISARTGKTEFWTQDFDDARMVLDHAATTNQDKLVTLQGSAKRMARNTCIAMFNGRKVLKYHKMNDFHEVLADESKVVYVPGERSPICTVDGIKFGVEICLDHAMETMKTLVASHQISGVPDFLVLLSAQVEFAKNQAPNGVTHFAHASSNQTYNMCESSKPNAVVIEKDDANVRIYSLIVSP